MNDTILAHRSRISALAATGLLAVGPTHAASALESEPAKAHLDFRIVVPAVLQVQAIRKPAEIVVTEADVLAGYVDLGACLELEVTNNGRGGYALQVGLANPMVREASLSGSGNLRVASGLAQLQVVRPPRSSVVSNLNYRVRLELAPGARPGRYPWPLNVTLARV